jgi:hypothetical protein
MCVLSVDHRNAVCRAMPCSWHDLLKPCRMSATKGVRDATSMMWITPVPMRGGNGGQGCWCNGRNLVQGRQSCAPRRKLGVHLRRQQGTLPGTC